MKQPARVGVKSAVPVVTTPQPASAAPASPDWVQQTAAGAQFPGAAWDMTTVYDSLHHVVVEFGGSYWLPTGNGQFSYTQSNQTWEWNGSVWTQMHPAMSPPARAGAYMSFDSSVNRVVLLRRTGHQLDAVPTPGSGTARTGRRSPRRRTRGRGLMAGWFSTPR